MLVHLICAWTLQSTLFERNAAGACSWYHSKCSRHEINTRSLRTFAACLMHSIDFNDLHGLQVLCTRPRSFMKTRMTSICPSIFGTQCAKAQRATLMMMRTLILTDAWLRDNCSMMLLNGSAS